MLWRMEVSLWEGSIDSPALASPEAWEAAGLPVGMAAAAVGAPGGAAASARSGGADGGLMGAPEPFAGFDLVVLSEGVEQLGAPEEAAGLVVRHVLGALRPQVLLVTTPNR